FMEHPDDNYLVGTTDLVTLVGTLEDCRRECNLRADCGLFVHGESMGLLYCFIKTMTSTLLEDASGNHQLRVYLVSGQSAGAPVTWEVPDLSPPVRLTNCPIVAGWASCNLVCYSLCTAAQTTGQDNLVSAYNMGEYVGELGIQRQFAKKEHEAKKLSQAGFAQECREADIYDAAALGPACTEAYSPKALEWSVVGNRMGLPSMTDFETAFSDLNELQRRTRKALTDSLPEACVLITVLVINIWAAYHQVGVEALSAWSLLVVVVFTCALIATLGASVSYYHGLFIILSVAISSFYARQGQEPLNPVEWSLAFIGLVTNAFADLSANDHLVVILTAFANLATLAAMALGQTGSRLHAQQQLAKLFARYRPSNTAVR
ncbi:unnamed protein product, partial [Durusdinium trenchii]